MTSSFAHNRMHMVAAMPRRAATTSLSLTEMIHPSLRLANDAFICTRDESLNSVIEKCLDNHTGSCIVLDETRHVLARVTLNDLADAILQGQAECVGDLPKIPPTWRRAASLGILDSDVVSPVLDKAGRFADVVVDHSQRFVPLAKPDLTNAEFRALLATFLSSSVSSRGRVIAEFERAFANYIGVRSGIATASGTAALHLALKAVDIGPDDEVIVPDLTSPATINAVLLCGATPVIVDVDPVSWTMSAQAFKQATTRRTKAVIPVHLYGRPAEIGPIQALARKHRIFVIENCADAQGARYAERPVGQFGDIACFSFRSDAVIATGEGGMCVTESTSFAQRILKLRDLGIDDQGLDWRDEMGFDYRTTNLQAALGSAQLARVDDILARNRALDALYREVLGPIVDVSFALNLLLPADPAIGLVCVQVPAGQRMKLIQAAFDAEIEIRPFFRSLSQTPAYARFAADCPHSAALSETGINLPTSSDVDDQVVQKIERIFRETLGSASS